LEDEQVFYIIDKAFWDSWSISVHFNDDMTITFKKEKLKAINNADLMEPIHEHRMKELTFNEDFIVVPK
jgi:hypothetical protein